MKRAFDIFLGCLAALILLLPVLLVAVAVRLTSNTNSPSIKWKKLALFTLGSASFYIFESGSV